MLERLEFADQSAELLALLEIIDGHVHRPARHARALRRRADAPGGEHGVENCAPAVDLADHRIAVELDSVELGVRGDRTVDQPDRVVAHPAGILGDREQGDAVFVAVATRGSRGNDHHVGAGAMDDEILLPGDPEAIARFLGLGADGLGAVLGAFVDGDGINLLAFDHVGQPATLGILAGMFERGCRQYRAGEEGRRGQVTADFL